MNVESRVEIDQVQYKMTLFYVEYIRFRNIVCSKTCKDNSGSISLAFFLVVQILTERHQSVPSFKDSEI
jgi:hypothetical protein